VAKFEQAIGPVLTNFGLRAWNLLLAKHEIVALPYTFWAGVKLGVHLYCGFPADPGEELRRHLNSLPLSADTPLRYYSIAEVTSISVVVSHGMNHIRIAKAAGGDDRYDIPKRPLTRSFGDTVRTMYPALYQEEGVPTSNLGRVLKS
jgi:hypothetical protein